MTPSETTALDESRRKEIQILTRTTEILAKQLGDEDWPAIQNAAHTQAEKEFAEKHARAVTS